MVTVILGTGRLTDAGFAGSSVGSIRNQFGPLYNVAAGAQAQVNGRNVADDYSLKAGDELIFSKPAGQKGN